MTYFYVAYGLTIASDFPLPELVPISEPQDQASCDVTVRMERDEVTLESPRMRLAWIGIGVFLVRYGREIVFTPYPESEAPAMRLALLGSVFAALLYQRGFLTLHASGAALRSGDTSLGAVGFLGDSRQGKSTMAAAFHAAGHRVVADDIIAIPPESLPLLSTNEAVRAPLISPGFPTLKLWPEATAEIYQTPEGMQPAPFASHTPRRIRDVRNNFLQDLLPLRCLYILEDGADIGTERLSAPMAIQRLMRHAYWTTELPPAEKETLFQQCITLAQRVDVYRLWRPRDLTRLPEVVRFIEAQLSATSQEPH